MKRIYLLLLFCFLCCPFLAGACQCVGSGDAKPSPLAPFYAFTSYDAVFTGEVINVRSLRDRPDQYVLYKEITLRVKKLYKGRPAADSTFVLRQSVDDDCDFTLMYGDVWLVTANYSRGMLNSSNCTHSGRFTENGLTRDKATSLYHFLENELPKLEGKVKLKHANGRVAVRGEFRNRLPQGELLYFNQKGKLTEKKQFEEGRLLKSEVLDAKTGAKVYDVLFRPDEEHFVETDYYDSGKPKAERLYLENEYTVRSYYENGQLKVENMKVLYTGRSRFSSFHENGQLKEQGWYNSRGKTGEWRYGTESGEVTTETYSEPEGGKN